MTSPRNPPAAGRADDPFRFVLGHVRSGTTLLRAMLDSHPLLAVPPESYFVRRLLAAETAGVLDPDRFAAVLAESPYFGDWGLDPDAVAAVVADPRVRTAADAVAGLYAAYARGHGKPAYGDKTPSHLRDVALLAARFPAARFLHLVRDGRDVTASVVTMDFGIARFAEAARSWRRMVLDAHRAGELLGPDRYQVLKYEDMVAEPEASMRRVCVFFGLEYDDRMLEYPDRAEELLAGLRHTGHVQGIRRPPTAGLRDWRFDLTAHQIAVFDEAAGSALDAFGYPRSGLRRSTRARAEVAGTELLIGARRAWRVWPARLRRRADALYRRVSP